MAYRSEIIRALDELIANGAGDLFQSIAAVHATQKWIQLVACERKWDGGLDAHADGALQPDGKGIGLACSITTTDSLGAALDEGQRIVLEAPAGSGKTTTLVQFARHVLSAGGLPFLVDLPEWVSSHRNILAYIAEHPAFGARDLDASLLAKLRGKHPPTFLLNGWNEVSLANAGAADTALRDLERGFPAATIIVTTRLHRLIPPLRDVVRVQLNQLDRSQRNEYLDLALKESAHDLKVRLDSNRTLDSITRTPLILAEVADLYRAGKEISPTKMGVLGAVLEGIEQSTDHRIALQQAPLRGHASDYLRALSMRMTELGETTKTSKPRPGWRGCESGHWIESVSDDGEIIKLEDGSIWEVDAADTVDSALWLPTTEIVACDGKLINTDDNEKVAATRIR